MNRHITRHSWIRQNLMMVIGVLICVYFVYHSTHGGRSYPHLQRVQSEISQLSSELDLIREDRAAAEQKVVMLRDGSINQDLLEERVRIVLGYVEPQELLYVASAKSAQ